MARPSELVPGNCYFMMNFYESDPPLVVPAIWTYLFVGQETHDGQRVWIFREAPSPGPLESAEDDDDVLTAFEDRQLYKILDLQGLIRQLGGLIDFHPLVKPTAPVSAPKPRTSFSEIAPQITRLLASDDWSWVTITIKYTDDGFSITPLADKIKWSFHPKVKTEAEREAKIRSIFRERQTPPVHDYTANAGQVRMLEYALRRDEAATVALCGRLLGEVYDMREDDELVFSFQPSQPEKAE